MTVLTVSKVIEIISILTGSAAAPDSFLVPQRDNSDMIH
jgi:hypothetical protein